MVWDSITFFSVLFIYDVFVSATGTSTFIVLITSVFASFVLVECVSAVLVLIVCFLANFEVASSVSPLSRIFFNGSVVIFLFLGVFMLEFDHYIISDSLIS
jgi:hypothetical protein